MNCNHILCRTLALALGLASVGARAQPALAQLAPAGGLASFQLQVQAGEIKSGTWVRYEIFRRDLKQLMFLELKALEREPAGQWLEMAITDGRQQTTISKLLIGGHLGAPQGVLRAMVQLAGQRPVLLPAELTSKQASPLKAGKDPQAQRVTKERVKVPAGTFLAEKYRKKSEAGDTLLWLSDQVAGWPLVKLSSPKLVWQLVDRGDSGKSAIEGEPQELPEGLLLAPTKPD